MANVNAPLGARRTMADDDVHLEIFDVPASDGTALYVGDAVKSNGTGTAGGIPQCIRAEAGDKILGFVRGFVPSTTAGTMYGANYRVASTNRQVLVNTHPMQEIEMMEDAVGGALAITNIGQNADIVYGTASTALGLSACMIDSSTAAAATAQLRILKLVQAPDNAVSAYGRYLVRINEHERVDGGAGV